MLPGVRAWIRPPKIGVQRPAGGPGVVAILAGLGVLTGGTALGQLAGLLAAPVLTRLYDAEAFGSFAVYAAVLSILVVAASLRFELAIAVSHDQDDAASLLVVSLLLVVVASGALVAIVFLWGDRIAALMGAPELGPVLPLIPIALLIAGVLQAVNAWATRQRQFRQVAAVRAVHGVGQAAGQLALGLAGYGIGGLMAGDLGGRLAAIAPLARSLTHALRIARISLHRLAATVAAHWRLAAVMTTSGLINAIALQVPFLLIPMLFEIRDAGQYFLAYRVLVLPAALVGGAAAQFFLGEASAVRTDASALKALTVSVIGLLALVVVPFYAILLVAGPTLFSAVFGAQWREAGEIAQILAPALAVWSVTTPISMLLVLGERQRESLLFTVGELITKAAALALGAAAQSLMLGILAFSVLTLVLNVGALTRFLRVAGVGVRDLRPIARRAAIGTAVALVVVAPTSFLLPAALLPAAALGWLASLAFAVRAFRTQTAGGSS